MQAIRIHEHGGPEVLRLEEVPLPIPGPGEILIRNRAIGVNFVDTQHRAGLNYPIELPLIPGVEAAGTVEALGSGVSEFKLGDRVGYAGYMGGEYAEATVVPEARLVPVPDGVSFESAAAVLMPGMTAHALAYSVYPIRAGDTVLIQAAAGSIGLLLVQMASRLGATVIGTVSNPEKAAMASRAGADHVLLSTRDDVVAETMRLTGGDGVHVVYDSVGRATFDQGIDVLQAQGHMVVYGLSSGPVAPFDVNRLSGITGSGNRGSLFLTWATLSDYASRREDLLWRARDVLGWIATGELQVRIANALPLADAAEAHRIVEGRGVIGKVLLIP